MEALALRETLKFTVGARNIARNSVNAQDLATVFSKCNNNHEIIPKGI